MRRLILAAFVLCGLTGLARADASSYSGVNYSTIVFSSAGYQCFAGEGDVVGFLASSNTASDDFLIFRDTDSVTSKTFDATGDFLTGGEFLRVFLTTTSAVNYAPGVTTLTTNYEFPMPIKVKRGLVAKASVKTINLITVLWRKVGAEKPK